MLTNRLHVWLQLLIARVAVAADWLSASSDYSTQQPAMPPKKRVSATV